MSTAFSLHETLPEGESLGERTLRHRPAAIIQCEQGYLLIRYRLLDQMHQGRSATGTSPVSTCQSRPTTRFYFLFVNCINFVAEYCSGQNPSMTQPLPTLCGCRDHFAMVNHSSAPSPITPIPPGQATPSLHLIAGLL